MATEHLKTSASMTAQVIRNRGTEVTLNTSATVEAVVIKKAPVDE
jgi:hypothetical protein